MPTKYNVGLIGFNQVDTAKMVKILHLTRSKDRHYQLKSITDRADTDLLLVNIDSDDVQIKNDYLKRYPNAVLVTVSKKQDAGIESPWHIKGLLLATRVIKVLDAIPLTPKNDTALLAGEADKINTPSISTRHRSDSVQVDIGAPNKPQHYDFNVLVVDDSPAMQNKLATELSHATQSIGVDFADSGEAALTQIKAKQYDFIFLDVMMPGMDGYDTCTELRKMAGMKKTPVIMLSAKTSPLDEVKGVMAGCTCYLTKPINSGEFQKMLTRVMGWLQDFKTPQMIT